MGVSNNFYFFNIPMFLETVFNILCIWSNQFKLESMVIPKHLTEFFSKSKISLIYNLQFTFGEWTFLKYIKFVLVKFKDNLLDLNQTYILDNSTFKIDVSVSKFVWE